MESDSIFALFFDTGAEIHSDRTDGFHEHLKHFGMWLGGSCMSEAIQVSD